MPLLHPKLFNSHNSPYELTFERHPDPLLVRLVFRKPGSSDGPVGDFRLDRLFELHTTKGQAIDEHGLMSIDLWVNQYVVRFSDGGEPVALTMQSGDFEKAIRSL